MNVALVGWTGSNFDLPILTEFIKIIDWKLQEPDKISFFDLKYDEDFLKDKGKYDIVVLIYIFRDSLEEFKNDPSYDYVEDMQDYVTSPLHSPQNWRKRFIESEAKDILIFGLYPQSEITGEYIGKLEGYKQNLIELRSPKIGVYGKIWRYIKCH